MAGMKGPDWGICWGSPECKGRGLAASVGSKREGLGSPWEAGCREPARFLPLPGKNPTRRSLSREGTELVPRLVEPTGTGQG